MADENGGGKMARPDEKKLNAVFDTLEEWNKHLKAFDEDFPELLP